jgi:hypothetical protein
VEHRVAERQRDLPDGRAAIARGRADDGAEQRDEDHRGEAPRHRCRAEDDGDRSGAEEQAAQVPVARGGRCRHGSADDASLTDRPDERRDLRGHDQDRGCSDEPRDHRWRHDVRNPPDAEHANPEAHRANHEREQDPERHVLVRAGHRERRERSERHQRGQRNRAGLEIRRRGQQGCRQRRERCSEEAALGRHACELRVRERLRQQDEGDGQPGNEIPRGRARSHARRPRSRGTARAIPF